MNITLIATTAMGLESVLAREIKELGFSAAQSFNGKIEFQGNLEDICRANLWLRTAGRILIKVGEFKATTFDELYEKTRALPWGQWIEETAQFPISKVTSRKSTLFSKSDCQSIIKKAVVDSLKTYHKVSNLPETGAPFAIRLQIENDLVTLSLDTSGSGLNKRGYRSHMDLAPLRETLAAGLVLLSRWRPDKDVLFDPLCGSGTILIEAGLIAKNIAPGLNRQFVSEQWQIIPPELWAKARQEAQDSIIKENNFQIFGSDKSWRALEIAQKNTGLAGLTNFNYQKLNLNETSLPFSTGKIITNPPYGERMDDQEETEALYKEMGLHFKKEFAEWSYYVITPHDDFEKLFKAKSDKHRKLFNGAIQCWYYQFFA